MAERVAAPRLATTMRQELLHTLTQRFGSAATLGPLEVRYEHGLLVEGHDLQIVSVLHGLAGDPAKPMLRIGSFSFRTSLFSLLRPTPRLHGMKVTGIQLELPPIAPLATGNVNAGEEGRTVSFDAVTFDDAHAAFASDDPKRAPMIFDFPHGSLSGIVPGKSFHFNIAVDNGSPVGITETTGSIGPWNFDDPRRTPRQRGNELRR